MFSFVKEFTLELIISRNISINALLMFLMGGWWKSSGFNQLHRYQFSTPGYTYSCHSKRLGEPINRLIVVHNTQQQKRRKESTTSININPRMRILASTIIKFIAAASDCSVYHACPSIGTRVQSSKHCDRGKVQTIEISSTFLQWQESRDTWHMTIFFSP